MIGNILTWMGCLIVILRFIKNKRRESILYTTQKGLFCYHCKSIISIDKEYLINKLTGDKKELKLCTSCERDLSIDKLINNKVYFDYKKYCFSSTGFIIQIFLSGLGCIGFITGLIVSYNHRSSFADSIYYTLGGACYLFSNIIMYIIFIVTSEPKKK